MKRLTARLTACVLVLGWFCAAAHAQVLPETGLLSKQSMDRLLLIDAERIGNRVVAVGDRGYIVYSDDNGESWRRAKTPGAPLLTALTFIDQKNGWAVGHDSMVFATTDGGENWAKQFSAEKEQRPLLDVLFVDKNVGFTVGAYGAFYETADGGKTWTARKILEAPPPPPAAKAPAKGAPAKGAAAAPAPSARGEIADDKGGDEDRHLNGIVKIGDTSLLIVGEAGTLLKSDDTGKTWTKLTSPYKGSFFGGLVAEDKSVVIFGLRGKIFRAETGLKSWAPVDNASVATLMGGTRLPDGALVIAGAAGTVLVSRDNGQSFSPLKTGTTKAYSKALLGAPNAVLLLGEAGARDVLIPTKR
jgi:photosystem II stability/assembly factor-like uncharacterized protein